MKFLKLTACIALAALAVLLLGLNTWGYFALGKLAPDPAAARDTGANEVVMVFGATGRAGGGLVVAAVEDPRVQRVYVVTRRTIPLLEELAASGKLEVRLHQDFTDYSDLADILPQVNTVLWALGTSSLQVDEATYTRIHVDFPLAFVEAWLAARQEAPMAFHFIAGMGTDGDAAWARDKRHTESETARLAAGTGLRSFSYRSAYIRPADQQSNLLHHLLQAVLAPGSLAMSSRDLGRAMLEISARSNELPNGTLIDAADSIAYARAYGDTTAE
ncbi:MAG: hypothetical protein H6988_08870 [Pseudomonadales bacterium]|nr:hypothetical protein [Halieaceae bacterium]MCP5164130.1 hypothetical protein [Pseudomonadales bacterium]MCP5190492.1 hypothetical protein [Pseudomonadales bacterium]MCP5203794.1 hypothetical protein [Pseudomonadales bacterium]